MQYVLPWHGAVRVVLSLGLQHAVVQSMQCMECALTGHNMIHVTGLELLQLDLETALQACHLVSRGEAGGQLPSGPRHLLLHLMVHTLQVLVWTVYMLYGFLAHFLNFQMSALSADPVKHCLTGTSQAPQIGICCYECSAV